MSGLHYIIIGSIIIVLSAVGLIIAEWKLVKKKKQIRQQTDRIYE